jgi:hypothetical protein
MASKRRFLLPLLWLWVAGCQCGPSQTPCSSTADCPIGQICDIQGTGLCFTPDGSVDAGSGDAGCPNLCPPWQTCIGQSCLSLYTSIQIVAPGPNAFVGPSLTVAANLNVVMNLTRNDPSGLNFAASPTSGAIESAILPLVGDGTFVGTWAPAQEGAYSLSVSYPDAGLTSVPITVYVLKTPPAFNIQVPAPPRDGGIAIDPAPGFAGAWKRDEVITLGISSADTHVSATGLQIVVVGIGAHDAGVAGPVLVASPATGCGQPFCATTTLDLSVPAFEAFRGVVAVDLLGQDEAGNTANAFASIPVTRWRWGTSLGGPLAGPPAVGHAGTLYSATTVGLLALNPDGTTRWAVDAGAPQSAPAVGGSADAGDVVYAAFATDAGATLVALSGATGSTLQTCAVGAVSGNASLAVASTTVAGQSTETAAALFADPVSPQLAALRLRAAGANQCLGAAALAPASGTAIATDGQGTVFFATRAGSVVSYDFDSGWPASPTWTSPDFGASSVALSEGNVISGGGLSANGIFALPFGSQSLAWSYSDGGASLAGAPAVGDGGFILYGDQSGAFTAIAVGDSAPEAAAVAAAPVTSAPVLGQGGFVYAADQAGNVVAWDRSLAAHWALAPSSAPAALAYDCSRDGTGRPTARPSVLYVGSDGGLYAVIVDSIGLDTSAAWPMTGHDPRRTASAAASLAADTCF